MVRRITVVHVRLIRHKRAFEKLIYSSSQNIFRLAKFVVGQQMYQIFQNVLRDGDLLYDKKN